ncbi:MAG: hypothetical protein RJA19_1401 [Bacteroidota bacterium]
MPGLLAAAGVGGVGLGMWALWEWAMQEGIRRARRAEEEGLKRCAGPRDFSVTVLVCVRDGEQVLPELLEGLRAQVPGPEEVLVVDDGSRDGTPQLLAAAQASWGRHAEGGERLRVLRLEDTRPGKKDAFAAGVEAARGEVIVATDADCVPAGPGWVEAMAAGLGGADPVWEVRLGVSLPTSGGSGWRAQWALADALRIARTYVAAAGWGRAYMGVGRNLAFRKACFPGWEGHGDLASGDDDLLVQTWQRLPIRFVASLHPAAQAPTRVPATGRAWGRSKRRHLTTGPRYPRRVVAALAWPVVSVGAITAAGAASWALAPAWFMHIGVWIVGAAGAAMVAVQGANFRTFAACCGLTGRQRFAGVWVPLTQLGLVGLTSVAMWDSLRGARRQDW